MSQQEDEWGLSGVKAFESLRLRTAQAKAQQIHTLEVALQTALHNQAAKLATSEHHAPAWPANRQARSTWQNQLAQAKTRLAQLERRSKRMGEAAQAAGLYADSLLDELALANSVFVIQTSPADGTLSSNSSAKPLYKIFTPIRSSNSTWVELAL
jgi:hypothetical protein